MFNVYLPDPIYERLPNLYLALAVVLALVPLSAVKWIAVASLLLAMTITRHQRQVHRETSRRRGALRFRQDLAYDADGAVAEAQLTRSWRRWDITGGTEDPQDPSDTAGEADLYRTRRVSSGVRSVS